MGRKLCHVDKQVRDAERQSRSEFKRHKITTLQDLGVYRAFHCAAPNTGLMSFYIVTFPLHLCIAGDIGDLMLCRCMDMLPWAMNACRSPGYFAEKVRAGHVHRFSHAVATEWIKEQRNDETITADDANNLIDSLDEGELSFYSELSETPSFDGDYPRLVEYTWNFLWCMMAMRWFARKYKGCESL